MNAPQSSGASGANRQPSLAMPPLTTDNSTPNPAGDSPQRQVYPLPDWFREKAKRGEPYTPEDRERLIEWFRDLRLARSQPIQPAPRPVKFSNLTELRNMIAADLARALADGDTGWANILQRHLEILDAPLNSAPDNAQTSADPPIEGKGTGG